MSRSVKHMLLFGLMLLLSFQLIACQKAENTKKEAGQMSNYVTLEMENGSKIVIELDAESAPITVANFQKLVGESFYDGITFHRAVPGFVIQGGDPRGNGTGGSDETIKGEFSQNGVDNPLKHVRGVLSMARSGDPDSASSQFFIVLDTNEGVSRSLDGQYAAFGKVIDGMDEVDRIAALPAGGPRGDSITEQPVISRAYFSDDKGELKTAE